MGSPARYLFPLIVIVLLVYLASQTLLPTRSEDRIAYSDLITKVEDSPQSIDDVLFVPKSRKIEVTLADGSTVESNYPTDASQLEFQHLLQDRNIHFDSRGTSD
jgi:ATP-dependent Zn protease